MAKILIFDLETAPSIGAVWGKWEQNVVWFVEHEYLLMFSYKWLGQKKTHAYGLPDFPNYEKNPKDDSALVKKLWDVLNEADIVIAHNGNSFDVKVSNTFFIARGLPPVRNFKSIDTKLAAKRHFRFKSNSLDDLGEYLGLGRKLETGGKDLWKNCMEGKKEAWNVMRKYNKQDVNLLEEVYLKLRPWMSEHPNLQTYEEEKTLACPKCGSENYNHRGRRLTIAGSYTALQCKDCGGWFQDNVLVPNKTLVK